LRDSHRRGRLRVYRRRRGVDLKALNLIRRDFDVTACRVTEVKPGHPANNLSMLVPDRISVTQDGEIGGIRKGGCSD